MKKFSWKGLLLVLMVAVLVAGLSGLAQAEKKDYNFAVCQGWIDNPSGQAMRRGYQDAIKEFGGNAKYVQAGYDPKLQSEQIESFIKAKPDAILVSASDTKAISAAVRRAVEAGIPVFAGDSLIAGAGCTTTVLSNNFGMGVYTGDFIAKKLGGKGKIGIIDLPSNETWDMRSLGLYWSLRKFPDMEVVASWSFNPAGNVKPRQAVDNMLMAHPGKDDLNAIWCAWDGAAMEGALAIKAAGRGDDIFTTGIDGGAQAFEYIKSGTPMKLSMAQSMYLMAYMGVYYAHQYLSGKKVPRLVVSPVYAITGKELEGQNTKEIGNTYDMPGAAYKLGWERAL